MIYREGDRVMIGPFTVRDQANYKCGMSVSVGGVEVYLEQGPEMKWGGWDSRLPFWGDVRILGDILKSEN